MNTFERYFRLWEYRVSHDQLLVRAAKNQVHPQNVDIIFAGVRWMKIATSFTRIESVAPTETDLAIVRQEIGDLERYEQVFVLTDGLRRSIVVAAGMKILENVLDYMESSLERFD